MADGIYVRPDGSYAIVDYKTAKFTAAQDELLPIYEVQLNAYAVIGERTAFYPVSELALIYMEPVTQGDALWKHSHDNGFNLDFQANILMVDLNTSLLDPLFKVARDIYDLKKPPQGNEKCENCKQLSFLLKLL